MQFEKLHFGFVWSSPHPPTRPTPPQKRKRVLKRNRYWMTMRLTTNRKPIKMEIKNVFSSKPFFLRKNNLNFCNKNSSYGIVAHLLKTIKIIIK